MKFPFKVLVPTLFLFLAMVACSMGGNSSNSPTTNKNSSNSAQSTSVGSSSSSADQSSSAGSGSSGSAQSSSGSSYGKVPLPTDTVDLKAGEVYKVGQAIKDPASGAIFEVLSVSKNNTWPGLNAGETYLLVDVLLGNAGSQTYSSSSMLSYIVKAKGSDTAYGLGHILQLLAAQVLDPNSGVDVDVAPGEAYHGVLPVALPADATGLTLKFTPTQGDGIGAPFTVDLGQ
jgi:hypothetical protein